MPFENIMESVMFVVVVEFTTREEYTERFLQRVRQQARDSLKLEVDCHVFDVCICSERKNYVYLYEVYSDKSAFDLHLASAHFRDFDDSVQEWVTDKRVSIFRKLPSVT